MKPEDGEKGAYWRKHARRYDRAIRVFNRGFPDMVAMVARDVAGRQRVLELAAGTGLVSVALAPVVGELTATDLSPEMLTVLKARLDEAGAKNVEVRRADALDLDLPDGSFDAVVAANVLHLLPDVDRALSEWKRVLRPGGLLCVPTFGHAETVTARCFSRLLGWSGFPIVTRFRAQELRSLVESHGFKVARAALVPGLLPLIVVAAEAPSEGANP